MAGATDLEDLPPTVDVRLQTLAGEPHCYSVPVASSVFDLKKLVGHDLGIPPYSLSFVRGAAPLKDREVLGADGAEALELTLVVSINEYDVWSAVRDNCFGAFRMLLESGQKLDDELFCTHIVSPHNEQMLRIALKGSGEAQRRRLVAARFADGRSPLHAATGNPKCVRLLLENGAERSCTDLYGETAYDYAVFKEDAESASLLAPADEQSPLAE